MNQPILHRASDTRSFVLDEQTTIADLTTWIETTIGAKAVQPKAGSLFIKCWMVSQAAEKQFTRSSIILFPGNRIAVLGPVVDALDALVCDEVTA